MTRLDEIHNVLITVLMRARTYYTICTDSGACFSRIMARAERMDQYSIMEYVVSRQLERIAPALICLLNASYPKHQSVPAGRTVEPHVACQVRAEMVLRPFQASVLVHSVECGTVLQLQVVDKFNVGYSDGVLHCNPK